MSPPARKHRGTIRLSNINFFSHQFEKKVQGFGISYDIKDGLGAGPYHDEREVMEAVGRIVIAHPDHTFEIIDERSKTEPEQPTALMSLDEVDNHSPQENNVGTHGKPIATNEISEDSVHDRESKESTADTQQGGNEQARSRQADSISNEMTPTALKSTSNKRDGSSSPSETNSLRPKQCYYGRPIPLLEEDSIPEDTPKNGEEVK